MDVYGRFAINGKLNSIYKTFNTMKRLILQKPVKLLILLTGFFITNALIAEFIGVKIFAFEETVGINPFDWNLFGHQGSLMLSAGVLIWPVVFISTDIINEYFGKKVVKTLSYLTAGLIGYAFLVIIGSIYLAPAGFWIGDFVDQGVPDMQKAYATIFGQGSWIIVASILAFLIGQVLDAMVFEKLRKATEGKKIWLRATGSTLISQFFDSFIVLYVAFVLGPPQWEISLFLAVGTVNYSYKFIVAILLTPFIYLTRNLIDRYLGEKLSEKLKKEALTM